ncbi:MAG: hypothetical protein ACR2PU_03955 [Gammaproteobacteria bacterium]
MSRTEFRNPRWLLILYLIIGIACGFVVFKWVRWDTSPWLFVSLSVFSILGFLAVIETQTSYMKLNKSTLEFRSWFKHKIIAKVEIESATWASGCPVSIKLKDGKYISLPESLMLNSQGTVNSIRAWLKRDD